MALKKVFYSWQSDNKESKNFLAKVIENIRDNYKNTIDITDATRDEPGSPNIIDTIMKKIDECDVFVCDLSICTKETGKLYPNSNVMFELGYAVKSIGNENCIILFDTSKYSIEKLPFDINHRRISHFNINKEFNIGDLVEWINMCTSKDISLKLTNKIGKFLKNIFESPNIVVTTGYINDLTFKVDRYVNCIDNTSPEYRQLIYYKNNLQTCGPNAIFNSIHNRQTHKNYAYDEFCNIVRTNINDQYVNRMLRKIFLG